MVIPLPLSSFYPHSSNSSSRGSSKDIQESLFALRVRRRRSPSYYVVVVVVGAFHRLRGGADYSMTPPSSTPTTERQMRLTTRVQPMAE